MLLFRSLKRSPVSAPAPDSAHQIPLLFLYPPFYRAGPAPSGPETTPPFRSAPSGQLTGGRKHVYQDSSKRFFSALDRAARCPRDATRQRNPAGSQHREPAGTKPQSSWRTRHDRPGPVRTFSTSCARRQAPSTPHEEPEEEDPYLDELRQLVGVYDIDPDIPLMPLSLEPGFLPTASKRISNLFDAKDGRNFDAQLQRLIKDENISDSELFQVYSQMVDLEEGEFSRTTIDMLLKRFSHVIREDEDEVIRYFTVLDYLKFLDEPLSPIQWNNAIRFASRSNRGIEDHNLDSAIHIWQQMEEDSNIQATCSTFNILIHGALLNKRWALVEKLIQEMERRGHGLDRYFHHTRLEYYGIRQGPSSVRMAYNQFVESGKFVATDILNTVMRSFILSGELYAAEHVYTKMKAMRLKYPDAGYFPHDYRSSRKMFRRLIKLDARSSWDPTKKRLVQNSIPLGPNLHTFNILIRGHATSGGDIGRILELLGEMRTMSLQPGVPIFYNIVRGFVIHGSSLSKGWTSDRLEAFWLGFLRAGLDGKFEDLDMSGQLTLALITAFFRCAGSKRAAEILAEVQSHWEVHPKTLAEIQRVLT